MVDLHLFDEVGEVVRGLVPRELGDLRCRAQRYGVKVWFDSEKPGRQHYEAQVVGARYVAEAKVLALEIGFHLEHPDAAANQAVLERLASSERKWRRAVGPEAQAGPFLGRDTWRRVSETWPDPDLSDPDLAMEVGSRLTDYICAIEPVLRKRA